MEKLYSGMSFLYREHGYNSTVFDIRMKNKVRGDYLTVALTIALKRFPYFNTKLVECNGDFYLFHNDISMVAHKTDRLRPLGSVKTGYHLIDVTYYETHIRVSWHHAVADGRGILPFIETLLYYYCNLKAKQIAYYPGKNVFDHTGIRLWGEAMLPGETADPFEHIYAVGPPYKKIKSIRDGFEIEENKEEWTADYRYEVEFDKEAFIAAAKSIGATPATFIALMISKAVAGKYPDYDKPILCHMAVDTRKALSLENTYKDCVGSITVPYTHEIENKTDAEISKLMRSAMNEQRGSSRLRDITNHQIEMMTKLTEGADLPHRLKAFRPMSKMVSNTFILSYIGELRLNDYAYMVDSMHLYNSGVKGLRTNMAAAGDKMALTIIKTFKSEEIISRILDEFRRYELDFTATGPIKFETPKDQTQATGALHSEHFMLRSRDAKDID